MNKQKNILITGVSRGLGLEITRNLLNNEYCVIGVSRTETEELIKLKKVYTRFSHIRYDLSDLQQIKGRLFNADLLFDTPIHGFVNNAAVAYDDIITNLNQKRLIHMYTINVFSPMMITKFVLRNMLLHRTAGSIIHISSISVHTGYKGLSMYASTKGALEAFSKNTAREWGEKCIRSNCIVAGFMDTDMSSGLNQEQKNRIYNRTSLKKPANPATIAHMVEFLLAARSESVTGQNLFIDSGTI